MYPSSPCACYKLCPSHLTILIKFDVYYRTVKGLRQIIRTPLSFNVSYIYDLGTVLKRLLTEPLLGLLRTVLIFSKLYVSKSLS
jgi:hypothetical protein